MIIDWTAAPEGTTHATSASDDPCWYKINDGEIYCWNVKGKRWSVSFFLTVDEIAETGLRLYANGEQSELVMLREQRDALLAAAKHAMHECCDLIGTEAGEELTQAIALVEGTK